MNPTEIRFTALPNGIASDGSINISVFISHYVPDSGPLPNILTNWPAVADTLQFSVDVRDGAGSLQGSSYGTARIGKYQSNEPLEDTATASIAWRSVFPSTTQAQARVAPAVLGPVLTYQTKATHDSLYYYHQKIANAETQADIAATIRELGGDATFRQNLNDLEGFHQPSAPPAAGHGAEIFQEFHNRLTAVLQYPTALKLLRLVVDLNVPTLKASALPSNGTLSVYVSSQAAPAGDIADGTKTKLVYPWVSYLLNTTPNVSVFGLAGGDPYGVALLDSPRYYTAGFDVDGGGLSVQHHVRRASPDRKNALTALPGRRNQGLQVFDLKYAEGLPAFTQYANGIYTAASNNPTPFGARPVLTAPTVDARVLQRGYRIDVQSSASGGTKSLCLRNVTANVLPKPVPRLEEAAVIKGVSSAPAESGAALKSNQLLMRWTGWSLVVPSPRQKPAPAPPTSVPFEVAVVPKSPPDLRYGTTYRIRARGVDLAGNGCTAGQVDFLKLDHTWSSFTFVRHDVVPPPMLTRAADDKPSSDIVVVRSDVGGTAAEHLHIVAPNSNFDTMFLSGALDNLSPAGNSVVPAGISGAKHFVDPATTGIVASIAWPANLAPPVTPVTVEYHARHTVELQRILVEENKPIRLTCRAAQNMSLTADVKQAKVALDVPPGRVVELMLRSLIPSAKLSQLELYGVTPAKMLRYGMPYSTLAGPVRIKVVHAVEKPLSAPAYGGGAAPVVVTRGINESAVHFETDNVSIDIESTGELELDASWQEVSDAVGTDGKWPVRAQYACNLASAAIRLPVGHPLGHVGATSGPNPNNPMDPINLKGTHNFGDVKGRHLSNVHLAAISRFARYYSTHPSDSPLRFALQSPGVAVAVPASAPPPPPQISYMVPTIGRREITADANTHKRETEAWGLRVYLNRGWFASGDGELLAATLNSTIQDPNGVCQLGADPARGGDIVFNAFQAADFRNGDNVPNVVRAVTGSATPEHLNIMAFPVAFDTTKNLLYADVVLRPQSNYRPFLRLALSRYQANALDQAQLSSTVTADFIQLGPKRSLSLAHHGERVAVTLVGPGTDQSPGSIYRTHVFAIMEHRGGHDEPWRAQARVALSPTALGAASDQTWTGAIDRTHDRHNRIVIEELEISDFSGNAQAPHPAPPTVEDELQGRLVYTDSVELP